jgi:endonuclease/exonuclease/phosphatase family metal-dependent hydrolase
VTWNVLWRFEPDWRARERALLATLDRLGPDLVGLQECWGTADDSQAHVIARHLGGFAAFAAPSLPPVPEPPEPPEHDDQAGVSMGVGLVSRWPIRVLGHHELPVSHRQVAPVALEVEVRRADAPVRVLVAAVEWEPAYADDHLAQTTRLAELLAGARPGAAGSGASGAGVPSILLADLNRDATQAEFAPLAAVADDTWELGGGDPHAVTLSSAVPFAPLEATKELDRRIDHVLVAPRGAAVVSAAHAVADPVDGVYPSDHFPVGADLELSRPSPGRASSPDDGRGARDPA